MKYFENFSRIDDYFRARKIERVRNIPVSLPGMGLEDDLFSEFDMHPNDMNFSIIQMQNKTFDTLLEMTASFSPDENPGKTAKYIVKETKTNTTYSTNVLSWVSISFLHNHLDLTILVVN